MSNCISSAVGYKNSHFSWTNKSGRSGFSGNCRTVHSVKNIVEALQTEVAKYKLSIGREVKTEISIDLLSPPLVRNLSKEQMAKLLIGVVMVSFLLQLYMSADFGTSHAKLRSKRP